MRLLGLLTVIFIRADSTFRWDIDKDYKYWNYLKGDTISFNATSGPRGPAGTYALTLENEQLTFIPIIVGDPNGPGASNGWYSSGVYKRVDVPNKAP